MNLRLLIFTICLVFSSSGAFAADWSRPLLSDTYVNVLSYLDQRLDDLATGVSTASTNLPAGTQHWNSVSNKWEKWTGTAWTDLAPSNTYGINVSGSAATATTATTATNATKVGGWVPSQTPAANQIPVLNGSGHYSTPNGGLAFYAPDGGGPSTLPQAYPNGITTFETSTGSWPGSNTYGQVHVVRHNNRVTQYFYPAVGSNFYLRSATTDTNSWGAWSTVWHSTNDGSGSGLDADLLDGQHANAFQPLNSQSTAAPYARYESGLRVIRGTINANGTIASGSGFSVSASGSAYTVTFTNAFSGTPTTTATVIGGGTTMASVSSQSASSAVILTTASFNGSGVQMPFNFVAIGPN